MSRKIFLILGQSGSGKTTLIDNALSNIDNLSRMNGCTTREKRIKENCNNLFLTDEQFNNYINKDLFIEWEEYAGIKHGLLKSSIDIQKNLIMEITPCGYFNFLKYLKDNNLKEDVFKIYIYAEKHFIEKRLKEERKMEQEEFYSRVQEDKKQFSNHINYDIEIENNNKDSLDIFLNFIKEKIGE